MPCTHPHPVMKRYVGEPFATYVYCPDCMRAWGGEETPAKRALIRAAAGAGVTEQDEVERRV
jgi:hypothetical protein